MYLQLMIATSHYPRWRSEIERYADGSSAHVLRMGRLILKLSWKGQH